MLCAFLAGFGGLVTGGIGPQPTFGLGHLPTYNSSYVAATKVWLDRYRSWGHLVEGKVQTLVYDNDCCHVQGLCEWVGCKDAVFTVLVDGTDAGSAAPAGGLIVYTSAQVVVPPSMFVSNGVAIALFQGQGIAQASVTLGSPADSQLRVIFTSPITNATLAFSGGFWDILGAVPVVVQQTVMDASGAVVSSHALFGGKAVQGKLQYVFDRSKDGGGLALCSVAFEKK